MRVEFFGQFLVSNHHISADDLREALEIMEKRNKSFCDLAVEGDYLSSEESKRLADIQKDRVRDVSELAISEGFLPIEAVQELLEQEQKSRTRVGEALLEIGVLKDENHLRSLLESFHAAQAEYEVKLHLPGRFAGHLLAAYVVEFLPKMAEKVSGIQLKVAYLEPEEATPYEIVSSLTVHGDVPLRVHLSSDRVFARKFFHGNLAVFSEYTEQELLESALAEFLNILLGNAIAVLEQQHNLENKLEIPLMGIAKYGEAMTYFPIVSTVGNATLGLEPL